jgi:hypothetical protein
MSTMQAEQKTERLLTTMAKAIDKTLCKELGRVGFVLLVFDFNQPGVANYVSNANRADMIKALRETADRLENKEDIPKINVKTIQ